MNTKQKELQFLGFYGICRVSFKMISIWKQIFLKLTLALTLPLSLFYLALQTCAVSKNILVSITCYIIVSLILPLLPTCVVYNVARIYSGKKITLTEVLYVVPKVWNRIIATSLCSMSLDFVSLLIFRIITRLVDRANDPVDSNYNLMYKAMVGILNVVVVWYKDVLFELAYKISVLETSYGLHALRKSIRILKGKMGVSFPIFFATKFCFNTTLRQFSNFVVVDQFNVGIFTRVVFGVIFLLLLSIVILLGVVVHTVFYLVCKSYHNEQIDGFALIDHLEFYHGEGYLRRKPKDRQLTEEV